MNHISLSKHFLTYFEPIVANTPELKDEVFRIRYKVYCEDLGYEPPEKFPDQKESDSYDEYSAHYLLRHIPSGRYAGCVRVIQPQGESSDIPFPFEKICTHSLNLSAANRHQFCEISRLAVLPEFRKRQGEETLPEGIVFLKEDEESIAHERRQFSVIALSLYWMCVLTGYYNQRDGVTLMETRLSRHINRCSLFSQQIGDFVEFRGKRAPFLFIANALMSHLYSDAEKNQDLKEFVTTLKEFIIPSDKEKMTDAVPHTIPSAKLKKTAQPQLLCLNR